MRIVTGAFLGLLLALAGPANAGDEKQMGRLDKDSMELLKKLHVSNSIEVQAGRLAKEKGSSEQVRTFGDHLVKDHGMADKQVLAMAKKNGLDLSKPHEDIDDAKKDKIEKLDEMRGMQGREFDEKFTAMMVKEHDDALELVKDSMDKVKDPELKTMLTKLQPKLEHHKEMAESLKDAKPMMRQGRRPEVQE